MKKYFLSIFEKYPNTIGEFSKLFKNYESWTFPPDATDWINPNTGESLTGYLQTSELSFLLNECIDMELY